MRIVKSIAVLAAAVAIATPALAADYKPEFLEAPITIDHEQKGPAWGWVKSVKCVGDLLLATMDVATEFADTIKKRMYKKRSVEIFKKQAVTGRPYLKAISFLGAAIPAVKGLADLAFVEEEEEGAFIEFEDGSGEESAAEFAAKTEDGEKYPAAAFLYVPDPEKPSSWKLRIWETVAKKVTRRQLGRAAAALSPGGFRGQRVDLPSGEVGRVKAKLRALYKGLGVGPEGMPFWAADEETRDYNVFYIRDPQKLWLLRPDLVEAIHNTTEFIAEDGSTVTFRESSSLTGGTEIPPEEATKMDEEMKKQQEQIAALNEQIEKANGDITALTKERDELKAQVEAGERERAKAEARRVFAEEKAKAADFPEVALTRLGQRFADAEKSEGIAEAFQAEREYLASLAEEGAVKGMGPSVATGDEDALRNAANARAKEKNISYRDALIEISREAKT